MEVTIKNFKETMPLVEDSIKGADFLVIDAEFTGLIFGPDVSIFDLPELYYGTVYQNSSNFLLVQFGLCAFRWDEKTSQYMNESYNFYVFPRGKPRPDKFFICQSSSLDFLASQGFDFNKVIKEGISYMTESVEAKLREDLTERQRLNSIDRGTIPVPQENKQLVEDICAKVRKFLDENTSDEMEIDRCNSFIRLLLLVELGKRFKDEAFVETKVLENKNRVLKVSRITAENNGKDRDTLKKEKEWQELEDAVGFSKVARMIAQSEKLVIGHNMLLDVMHTLSHFFQPLPADYKKFKEFTHCMFPRLLDTKYMCSLPPFKDKVASSVLSHLLMTLAEPPFNMPKIGSLEGRGYAQTDERHHEAGYDAYVTGLCFLAMHGRLADMRGDSRARVNQDSAALKPFLNKLFLAKTAHQDSPYMNLAGEDPSPSRDHVFHLQFPKDWLKNDINQLFSPFGPIIVQFIDNTSAMVGLQRRELARDAMRALNRHGRVTLTPYAKYKYAVVKSRKQIEQATQEDMLKGLLSQRTTPWTRPPPPASSTNVGSLPKKVKPPLPEKVERTLVPESEGPKSPAREPRRRSQSVSLSPVSKSPNRKRTSSGVFQVDEAEPPPKKPECGQAPADPLPSRPEVAPNGRRKATAAEAAKEKPLKKKVIERFDKSGDTKCVAAFKESESWD